MADWSQGYPTQSGYVDAIQPAIAPARWRQALAFAGRQAPDPDRPFRFLELGCGTATTLIALAAAHPRAQFTGYDFMPDQVAQANALIAEAGLDNVEVIEGSFAQMAQRSPEENYDFAVTHGVWSWVPEPVIADMQTVLSRWLAPGAVFYVGYNSAAGWAASEPIRQIFRSAPPGPPGDLYGPARRGVTEWLQHMGDRFPMVRAHWATLQDSSDTFMAHELANPCGTGLWPEAVAAQLSEAKLAYGGPAVLAEHLDAPYLEPEAVDTLRTAIAEGWAETARDLLHMRYFRKDLFHRGAPEMSASAMVAGMRGMRMIPWALEPRMATHLGVYKRLPVPTFDARTEHLREVAAGPDITFGDLMDTLGMEVAEAFQTVMMTWISGALLDVRAPEKQAEAAEGCARFNAALLRRAQDSGHLPGLVSPVTGTCLQFPDDAHREALIKGDAPAQLLSRLEALEL